MKVEYYGTLRFRDAVRVNGAMETSVEGVATTDPGARVTKLADGNFVVRFYAHEGGTPEGKLVPEGRAVEVERSNVLQADLVTANERDPYDAKLREAEAARRAKGRR